MTLEFDGGAFHGWQVQPGLRTVQGELEKALATILRRNVPVTGQGRTDAGVHAEGQVAHLMLEADEIEPGGLVRHLNGLLGPDCSVREAAWAPDGFNARYSALSRTYRYQIVRCPSPLRRHTHWLVEGVLDLAGIRAALPLFVGEHDFGAYCAHSREMEHTRCVVSSFTLGEEAQVLTFRITADRFLHNMVRRLVGEMIELGAGRLEVGVISNRVDQEGPAEHGHTAPAHGLVLESVAYP